jgi:type I restriction enzyme S subunit
MAALHQRNRALRKGWQRVPLRDVCPLVDGDWILSADYAESGVRLLQVGDVGVGRFVGRSSRFVTRQRAEELGCTFLRPGDILISRMPDPIGRACLLPDLGYPCITAVDVSIWRPEADVGNRDYLVHYLCSAEWLREARSLASGATRPRISRKNLEGLEIPLPPLEEQKRIAAILKEQMAAVERARAAAEARLEAAKALPAAFLCAAFNSPETHNWPLGQHVTKIGSGITPRGGQSTYLDTGIALIRSQNVHVNRFVRDGLAYISTEQDHRMRGTRVLPGDVLLNITGASIGRACVVPTELCPANVNQHVSIVRCKATVLPAFLSYYIACPSTQQLIAAAQAGATKQALTKTMIAALPIPIPPLDEQRRIGAILSEQMAAAERTRMMLEQELKTISALPPALLRRAFAGRL